MVSQREKNLYLARIAEESDRHTDMVEFMTAVSKCDQELSAAERNSLSVAFRSAVGPRRGAWRSIKSNEEKETSKGNTEYSAITSEYCKRIEKELREICENAVNLLDSHLIPSCTTGESKVFYYKMKGDYYRYIAEFAAESEKKSVSNEAHKAYQEATVIAQADLAVTHPIRLGLALNYSVFYYEVLQNPEEACRMAKQAFEEAICDLDNVDDHIYRDSTVIMQLLRDNLQLWTNDQNQGQEDGAAAPAGQTEAGHA